MANENTHIAVYQKLIAFAIPISILLSSIYISQLGLFEKNNNLGMAITYDLCLVSPFLYLTYIWKKDIPKTTVLPIFIGGLATLNFLLPSQQRTHFEFIMN